MPVIAYVCNGISRPNPGAQTSTRILLEYMRELGSDEFKFVALSPPRNRIIGSGTRNVFSGTPVDHIRWLATSSSRLSQICEVQGIDLVNIHTYGGYVTLPPKGIPTIITPHDEPILGFKDNISPTPLRLLSKIIASSDKAFRRLVRSRKPYYQAISSSVKHQLIRLGVSSQRIRVIPNGFRDIKRFCKREERTLLLRELGLDSSTTIVLSIGALTFRKGVHRIMEVAKLMKTNHPHIHFVQAGKIKNWLEKGYFSSLEKQFNLNALSNFSLLGHVRWDDLMRILECSDLFLLPSYSEACSQALSEAMTLGLPIVATDVGSARDLLEREGHIVSRYAAASEIKDAVLEGLRQGRRSYSKLDIFGWRNVARMMLQYYRDVLELTS